MRSITFIHSQIQWIFHSVVSAVTNKYILLLTTNISILNYSVRINQNLLSTATSATINDYKAHLIAYPTHIIILASTLRMYLTVGLLFSSTLLYFLVTLLPFIFSIRESYFCFSSSLSTIITSVLYSELMLFVTFFWGNYHFTLCPVSYLNPLSVGLFTPTSRLLIIGFIIILASASIFTGYAHTIREKLMAYSYSISTCLCLCVGFEFASLQTNEFINADVVYGNFFFYITSLHFSHVVVGCFLLTLCFWNNTLSFLYSDQWAYTSLAVSVQVLTQLEYFTLLYWHLVESLWLIIDFILYFD